MEDVLMRGILDIQQSLVGVRRELARLRSLHVVSAYPRAQLDELDRFLFLRAHGFVDAHIAEKEAGGKEGSEEGKKIVDDWLCVMSDPNCKEDLDPADLKTSKMKMNDNDTDVDGKKAEAKVEEEPKIDVSKKKMEEEDDDASEEGSSDESDTEDEEEDEDEEESDRESEEDDSEEDDESESERSESEEEEETVDGASERDTSEDSSSDDDDDDDSRADHEEEDIEEEEEEKEEEEALASGSSGSRHLLVEEESFPSLPSFDAAELEEIKSLKRVTSRRRRKAVLATLQLRGLRDSIGNDASLMEDRSDDDGSSEEEEGEAEEELAAAGFEKVELNAGSSEEGEDWVDTVEELDSGGGNDASASNGRVQASARMVGTADLEEISTRRLVSQLLGRADFRASLESRYANNNSSSSSTTENNNSNRSNNRSGNRTANAAVAASSGSNAHSDNRRAATATASAAASQASNARRVQRPRQSVVNDEEEDEISSPYAYVRHQPSLGNVQPPQSDVTENVAAELAEVRHSLVVTAMMQSAYRRHLEDFVLRHLDASGALDNPTEIPEQVRDWSWDAMYSRRQQELLQSSTHRAASSTAPARSGNDDRETGTAVMEEIRALKRMVKLCLDFQQETQRAIRQEVSAALYTAGNQGNVPLPFTVRGKPVKAGVCVVCCEDPVNSMLYRCGHLCTCFQCGQTLVERQIRCPICRAPITEVVRAYSSGQPAIPN